MLTSSNKTEYWFHVSNQDEIPIYGTVDKSFDIDVLLKIISDFPKSENERERRRYIMELIAGSSDIIDILRTLVGVSDKRMYLELSFIFGKAKIIYTDKENVLGYSFYDLQKHNLSFFKGLTQYKKSEKNGKSAVQDRIDFVNYSIKLIGNYLIGKGILNVLISLKKLDKNEISEIVNYLILTSENQQAETKRRGHGAEWMLAKLLNELSVIYIPEDKHKNPMSSDDPNVDKKTFLSAERNEEKTWSFDLIIKENQNDYKIFIQGLIHTSDPGQYGVNKSKETVDIKQSLKKHNEDYRKTKELWGLVDGVGFIENPENTIFKMLNEFDTFVQLKTLYKAGLRLHKLNLIKIKAIYFDTDFYNEAEAKEMFIKYGSEDIEYLTAKNKEKGKEVNAGKACLYI